MKFLLTYLLKSYLQKKIFFQKEGKRRVEAQIGFHFGNKEEKHLPNYFKKSSTVIKRSFFHKKLAYLTRHKIFKKSVQKVIKN